MYRNLAAMKMEEIYRSYPLFYDRINATVPHVRGRVLEDREVRTGVMLIAISSSRCSPNILNAVYAARQKHTAVITLNGFIYDNYNHTIIA